MTNLSTAEMLDKLGLDDVAVNQQGNHVGYDHKGNLLMWFKNEEKPGVKEGNEYNIYYPFFKKDRWTINHQFIGFEEAMDELEREKRTVIYFHDNGEEYRFHPGEAIPFAKLAEEDIRFSHLTKGRWKIEY